VPWFHTIPITSDDLRRGLFTRKSFVAQHPDIVENVLRALIDSITFIQEPGFSRRPDRAEVGEGRSVLNGVGKTSLS
jgi:ABC-type nitrate/sulfonate/bicarbonate transport system substrate-binding protein